MNSPPASAANSPRKTLYDAPVTIELPQLAIVALIGLAAGLAGGLLGIGGSIIMIPGLVLLFHDVRAEMQHVYQAAAMAVNVAVALPATIRHQREGAVRRDLFVILLPAAAIAMIIGVLLSNRIPALTLRRVFAAFVIYAAAAELLKLFKRTADHPPEHARITIPRAGAVGGAMGFVGGLLGVGGGVIAVPLAQWLCRLPVRQAIATSAAAMVFTAAIGAAIKFTTLPGLGLSPSTAAVLALLLGPSAMVGAWIGAHLTHRLPLDVIRAALVLLLTASAWRMAGI